jgi:hypothetical protein
MRIFLLSWLMALSFAANASGRIFTYFEGHLVKRGAKVWQVATSEGTYWIDMTRQPSWLKIGSDHQISFWVATDQVVRFRPPLEIPMHENLKVENIVRQFPKKARASEGS